MILQDGRQDPRLGIEWASMASVWCVSYDGD